MSRKANGYDIATMKSFWSTLKQELIYRRHFPTRPKPAWRSLTLLRCFTAASVSSVAVLWAIVRLLTSKAKRTNL